MHSAVKAIPAPRRSFHQPKCKARSQRKAMRDKSLRVPRIVKTKLVEQKQILEFSREKSGVRADRLAPKAKSRKPRNPPAGSQSRRLNTNRSGTGLQPLHVRLPRRSEESSMWCGQRLKPRGSSKAGA
jgi:hypothetical protein